MYCNLCDDEPEPWCHRPLPVIKCCSVFLVQKCILGGLGLRRAPKIKHGFVDFFFWGAKNIHQPRARPVWHLQWEMKILEGVVGG